MMADPKACGQDPAQIIRELRERVSELIQDAAKWQARAELRTFERDEARREAKSMRDYRIRCNPYLEPFSWEVEVKDEALGGGE